MALRLDSIKKKKKKFESQKRSSIEDSNLNKETESKRGNSKVKPWSEELASDSRSLISDEDTQTIIKTPSIELSKKPTIDGKSLYKSNTSEIQNENSSINLNKSKFKILIPRIFYQYTK
jgi:hypothetical protein